MTDAPKRYHRLGRLARLGSRMPRAAMASGYSASRTSTAAGPFFSSRNAAFLSPADTS